MESQDFRDSRQLRQCAALLLVCALAWLWPVEAIPPKGGPERTVSIPPADAAVLAATARPGGAN